MPGGGGGGGAMPPMGDMGSEGGDMGGEEGSVDMGAAPEADGGAAAPAGGGQEPLAESWLRERKYANIMSFTKTYFSMLHENTVDKEYEIPDINTGSMVLEEEVDRLVGKIDEMVDSDLENLEDDIDETAYDGDKLED
jgi:hypothetical protein